MLIQWTEKKLNYVDRTHPVLASGKLLLKKHLLLIRDLVTFRRSSKVQRLPPNCEGQPAVVCKQIIKVVENRTFVIVLLKATCNLSLFKYKHSQNRLNILTFLTYQIKVLTYVKFKHSILFQAFNKT